jgi:hypothetical protein
LAVAAEDLEEVEDEALAEADLVEVVEDLEEVEADGIMIDEIPAEMSEEILDLEEKATDGILDLEERKGASPELKAGLGVKDSTVQRDLLRDDAGNLF